MKKSLFSHIKRYYKHYTGLILFLLLLLIAGGFFFVRHYKPLLSERLKKQVYLATDSLYRVTFSEVHLNPLLRRFTLDSLHLVPDTQIYQRLKLENRAPANLFDIFIDEFQMRKIHLWSLVLKKNVNIEIIKAENPVIKIYHGDDPEAGNKETVHNALYNLTSGSLHSIRIDHLGFHNVSLTYKNLLKPDSREIKLKNMEMVFRDIKIDPSTARDPSRFLFAKDIWFHLDESRFFTSDSLYEITTKGIGFSVMAEQMIVKELKIIPRLSERQFDRRLTYRKDRFSVAIDSLLLEGLSREDLQKQKWHIKKLSLRHGNVDIYMNRSLPLKPVEKPLLQEALHRLKPDVRIDTLHIDQVDLKYRELNPVSDRVGYVSFNHIQGAITNITNDSVAIRKNSYCKADLYSDFMDHGKLHAVFNFNLAARDNAFTYQGHLGFLNATVLNPATRPLGMVRIKSGRIQALDFHFNANNNAAKGTISLKYDRLGVSVLAKNDKTGDLKKKGLESLAANLLVLKDNNLYDSLAIQNTSVFYQREPYRSVFNLMWKSIFTGAKTIVGFDKKTEEEIKKLKQTGQRFKNNQNRNKKEKQGNFFQKAKKFLDKTFSDSSNTNPAS